MENIKTVELLNQIKDSINTGIENTSNEASKYKQLIDAISNNENLSDVRQEFEKTLVSFEESIEKMKEHKSIVESIIETTGGNEQSEKLVGDLLKVLMRR